MYLAIFKSPHYCEHFETQPGKLEPNIDHQCANGYHQSEERNEEDSGLRVRVTYLQ